MNVDEIRNIAIDSAKVYYNYLEQNEKGLQIVDVNELQVININDSILKLRLAARLFDIEAIFFKNIISGRKYDASEVQIIEYDKDKNILFIKPKVEYANDFRNLVNTDLKVISDLKFLIEKVKAWYELNGTNIHLPNQISKLKNDFHKISYLSNFQPSQHQKNSLANIFNNPFSYVWGAPGTGKTQYVLSYAIMHYINNNCKVAILAPTNNAIEQVLRGVLKMIKEAGIDETIILRLGVPTSKFAEEYPQICEVRGVLKRIEEIDKRTSTLKRIMDYEQALLSLNKIENKLSLFNDFSVLSTKRHSYDNEFEKFKRKEIDISYAKIELNDLNTDKALAIKKLNSFRNKLRKAIFSNSLISESEISRINELIKLKYKEIEFLKVELKQIENNLEQRKNDWDDIQQHIDNNLEELKSLSNNNSDINLIVNEIGIENWRQKSEQLTEKLNDERAKLEIDGQLFNEYQFSSLLQIKDEVKKLEDQRAGLHLVTTEERLKKVNVIACTLDGYIARYSESKLDVQHIFLDEAGYANIIKTLTLFNHDIPISLLGDHMQLPPVCEISDGKIRENESLRNVFLWSQSSIFIESLFQKTKEECLNEYLNKKELVPNILKQTNLISTYRFGQELAEILRTHIYPNFESRKDKNGFQIEFINAKKVDALRSWKSSNEVSKISTIVSNLRRDTDSDFIILTPYRSQIRLLNNALPEESRELKILTIHGSQGREWDTVILSVVDTSDMFFMDGRTMLGKKLLNTAVSRAKEKIIIVCDKDYWITQNGQLITDLLKCGKELTNQTSA